MPRNVKPFELVQLLLMENRSKDKFLDFQGVLNKLCQTEKKVIN